MNNAEVKDKIANAGLKATTQRIVILKALLESREHPTAEELYNEVKDEYPALSLSTVYNTLDCLVEKALVKQVQTEGGNMRYDAFVDIHHHLYCSESGKISDYYNDELNHILEDFFAKHNIPGFIPEEFKLNIKGKFIENGE